MMNSAALYIAPYALDKAMTVHCREGLSVIEMDNWRWEIWLDYGVRLAAVNDDRLQAYGCCAASNEPSSAPRRR